MKFNQDNSITIQGREYHLVQDSIINGRLTYKWIEVPNYGVLQSLNKEFFKTKLLKLAKQVKKQRG